MAEEASASDAAATPDVPKIDLSAGLDNAMTNPKGKMPTGLAKRAGSAPKERPPPPPITPRNKKASRSLFRELTGTVRTMMHSKKRVESTLCIVKGVKNELIAAVESSTQRLADNARMVAGTKDTTPGETKKAPSPKSPTGGGGFTNRSLTIDEWEELRRELRDNLEAAGEERDPSEEELQEEANKRMEEKRKAAELSKRRQGLSNKGIVDALEKLRSSSKASVFELEKHQLAAEKQIFELDKVITLLTIHMEARDALFDPVKSTDLPFAKRMGVRPIERSVLYQKMNLLPKNRDGSTLVIDWNDKDQEASEGKKMHEHFKDDKGHAGLTAHEATFAAASCEDAARFVCNSALKAVRDAQSQLAQRKSALQVAVLESRQLLAKQNRAAKSGKFGSSEERNTDPSTRKMATNPEDTES